jgi:acylphosphatase
MIRKRVVVHGRVQGVFYRDSCRREARAAGVSGWVRNCADGAVEAVFEGPDEAVGQLVAWAAHGPVHARVDHIDEYDEQPLGESGFTVTA